MAARMSDVNLRDPKTVIEVVPRPHFKGDWLVRCDRLQPYPIWFKDREQAVSYAEWLGNGRDVKLRA